MLPPIQCNLRDPNHRRLKIQIIQTTFIVDLKEEKINDHDSKVKLVY